jgi:deoxycytidylate deaminase
MNAEHPCIIGEPNRWSSRSTSTNRQLASALQRRGLIVAQCEGKTKKGDRCKRDTQTESSYCSIHVDQERRSRTQHTEEWDRDAIMKAAIGFALVGAIFLFRFRR